MKYNPDTHKCRAPRTVDGVCLTCGKPYKRRYKEHYRIDQGRYANSEEHAKFVEIMRQENGHAG